MLPKARPLNRMPGAQWEYAHCAPTNAPYLSSFTANTTSYTLPIMSVGSGSAFIYFYSLVRNPLLRNFLSLKTAITTPLPFRESASYGIAEKRTYKTLRTGLQKGIKHVFSLDTNSSPLSLSNCSSCSLTSQQRQLQLHEQLQL